MINDILTLAPALVAGALLGAIFFGGLWWTVRKGVASKHPAPWLLGSLIVRTGIVLAGFYFVSGTHWNRLLVCLLGFTIARFFVVRFTGPPVEHGCTPANGADHAP